ncbi:MULTISPECIES: type II secretion system protein GspC [unclassified Vibrio]|uniref:Type II secretion system protein GspC n=1 Tax=Vibrio sp. HB236076 TaxID=3232307 RepID=A0AB39HED8_9VIBR|nr:type II secretion system protein GspC [Vibrio sp. HB161653]MDP5255213.1 type II secretion system protein GspC [Vibrio sp. HB161653]
MELSAISKSLPWLTALLQHHLMIQSKTSVLATLGCLAVSGWIVGQSVWLVVPDSQALKPWRASAVTKSATEKDSTPLDLAELKAAHLFGEYRAQADEPKAPPPVVKDAPKTRLNLTLVGAVASSDPKLSLAVIANRGDQATYGVGESIEGTKASLKAVYSDRVIIENVGRDETLMLQGIDYDERDLASGSSERSAREEDEAAADELASIKQQVRENPQSLLKYVKLSQVTQDGEVQGFRLSPGSNAELFTSLGLEEGDIAIELNGLDLTDQSVLPSLAQSLSDPSELDLTVLRDGQRYNVFIQF